MIKSIIELQVVKLDDGTYTVDVWPGNTNTGDGHPMCRCENPLEALNFIRDELNRAFKDEVSGPAFYKLSVKTWARYIGGKISTIKLLREMTGMGLLEAKQMSEAMEVGPVEVPALNFTPERLDRMRSFGVTVEPVTL